MAAILKMSQARECIPKFPVEITDSNSMSSKLAEKYKFVDLWEGCMAGLPRLQPSNICTNDGPEFVFYGCSLEVWHNDTNNNSSHHTILVSNESMELVLSICVYSSDHQACVNEQKL